MPFVVDKGSDALQLFNYDHLINLRIVLKHSGIFMLKKRGLNMLKMMMEAPTTEAKAVPLVR